MISHGRVSLLCPKTMSFSERTGLIHTFLPLTLLETHTHTHTHTHTAPRGCHNAVLLPRNSKPWVHMSVPGDEGDPQWKERRRGGRHLLRSQLCTGQSHCHTRARWSLLHTWWVWPSEPGAGAARELGRREVVGHFSKSCWRRSARLWGLTPSATRA